MNPAVQKKKKPSSSFHAKEARLSGFQVDPVPAWQEGVPQLHRKRSHHGGVLLDSHRVLVVGGYEKSTDTDNAGSGSVLRSVEVYDRRTTRQWDHKSWPKLTQHRAEHAAVRVENRLYVMGGRGADGACLDSIECLDLASSSSSDNNKQHSKWVTLDMTLSSKKRGCTAVAVGSLVYVMGGTNDQNVPLNAVDVIDTVRHKVHPGLALPTPRYGADSVVVLEGGSRRTIYVVGGQDGAGKALPTIESLAVTSSKSSSKTSWCTLAVSLRTPRIFPAVTVVSHCLFVIGGRTGPSNDDTAAVNTVEVVDTKRESVWYCASLKQPICGCRALTLEDSRVAVLGGTNHNKPLNTMQVLQLKFLPHETHVAAVERELQEVRGRGGGGGPWKKMLGRRGTNENKQSPSASKLKAYLKELKSQGSTRGESYDSDDDSVGGIERCFEKGLPTYDNGRIVAKKKLKDSGQAQVFRGTMQQRDASKKDVAIKVFKSKKDWDDCKQELMALLKISGHPNVMDVLDFFEVPMPAFVMRYVSGGDLRDYLDEKGKLSGQRAVDLLRGIGEGLRHLHRNSIVHRDLKSLNILLEGKGRDRRRPVLIDLGLGKAMQQQAPEGTQFQTRGVQGTAGWMAPEMMSRKWSTKTDMYAVGVIMWEILTGASPFSGKGYSYSQILKHVKEGGRPDKGQMAKARVPQPQQQLVHRLWDQDPSKRPSADQFLALLESTK